MRGAGSGEFPGLSHIGLAGDILRQTLVPPNQQLQRDEAAGVRICDKASRLTPLMEASRLNRQEYGGGRSGGQGQRDHLSRDG